MLTTPSSVGESSYSPELRFHATILGLYRWTETALLTHITIIPQNGPDVNST